VPRRFSEAKKFWDALRPIAAACGAALPPFPAHSALLTGQGATGNLYETNPDGAFARRRVELLGGLARELSEARNATGGTLFGLKVVRAFLQIDELGLVEASPVAARDDGPDASRLDAERKRRADADRRAEQAAAATKPGALGALLRSTPATALLVFACVLSSLVYLEG